MPPLAAIGASIAGAATAGVAAIGSAVGGLTLAGIAQGASIVGAGLSVVGGITGSKTLQKIGMGFSIAGGGAALANSISGMSTAKGLTATKTAASGLLSEPLKGSKMVDRSAELWQAPASKAASANASNLFSSGGSSMAAGSQPVMPKGNTIETGSTYDPGIGSNIFQRANSVWSEYAPWLNVAGGMGEAYMIGKRMDMEKDIDNRRLDIEQAQLDRLKQNTGPIGINIQPSGYTRTPLLQYNNQ